MIVNPSPESRSELAGVLRNALPGRPVTLADDALAGSNWLSLEHADPRDQAGRPLNGRELSRPETFQLFKRGSRCVLMQLRTGRTWTLRHAECVPWSADPSVQATP